MKQVIGYRIVEPAQSTPLAARLWVSLVLALIVVFLLLARPAFTHAQDELVTNTPDVIEATATVVASDPVVTLEPTAAPELPPVPDPVIVDQTGFRVGAFGFLAIIVTILLGGVGLGVAWSEIRHSKAAKDNLEMAFESISPKTQEDIRMGYEAAERAWDKFEQLAHEVFDFIGEVTDKQPNDAGS